jgi:hypothetical protein
MNKSLIRSSFGPDDSSAIGFPGLLPALARTLVLFVLLVSTIARADDEVIRISRSDDGAPLALEVVLLQFAGDDGIRVDLVGAVHVGETAYFQTLNHLLGQYDRVLFELVGDPASLAAPKAGTPSVIGLLQGGMKDALGLSYQLDEIDYSPAHFVHADLGADEFRDSMRNRNESWFQLMLRAWALGMAQQGKPGAAEADLLKVLLAEDRRLALRRLLATQLADQAGMLELISGEDGSTLIEIRNGRALEVLEQELAAGHRRLAIFYGAGHLPDLARRLEQEFGLRRTGSEWLPAWKLAAID